MRARPATDDGLWVPARRALTVGLVLTITFIASEALAVVTVMPLVAKDLGGLHLYGWAFSAFMLGSVVGIVAAGREADRHGPARPYVLGLILFGVGLSVAGTAPTMELLVVGRALQGVGAGAVPSVAYVAIGRSLPEGLRARMMAVLSTAWVVPAIVGPAVSAQVARLWGWRSVFLGLLPLVGAAGLLALPALVRLGRAAGGNEAADEHRLADGTRAAAGAGLLLGGLGAQRLLLAVPLVLVGAAVGLPALRRLLPPGTLVARPGLPATILARGLLTFTFFGADAFVTLSITAVRHHTTTMASLAVTVATLGWTSGSWVQARMSERWEGRRFVRLGLVLILVGIAGMVVTAHQGVPIALAPVAWAVSGLGMGLAYAPISLMMLREAPAGREGWASASLNLTDALGVALGAGLGGAAVASAPDLSSGVVAAFAVAAAGGLVALAVTARLPQRGLRACSDGPLGPSPPGVEPALEQGGPQHDRPRQSDPDVKRGG